MDVLDEQPAVGGKLIHIEALPLGDDFPSFLAANVNVEAGESVTGKGEVAPRAVLPDGVGEGGGPRAPALCNQGIKDLHKLF